MRYFLASAVRACVGLVAVLTLTAGRGAPPRYQEAKTKNSEQFKATPAVQALIDAAKANNMTWQERISKAQPALDEAIRVKDRIGEGYALDVFARCYVGLNQLPKAIGYYERELTIARETGNRFLEAGTQDTIGQTYRRNRDAKAALEHFKQALLVATAMKDPTGESYILRDIGFAYQDLGHPELALDPFDKSLAAAKVAKNRSYEAETLFDIGHAYDELNEHQKALTYLEQAAPIYHEVGSWGYESETLCDIGFAYLDLGKGDQAIKSQEAALAIERDKKNPPGEASVLRDLGETYSSLGEKSRALQYFNDALAIRQNLGYKAAAAGTLADIAYVYASESQNDRALEYFKQALQIDRDIGDAYSEVTDLNSVGATYAAMGQKAPALENLDNAMVIVRKHNDRDGEALTEANIGRTYAKTSEYEKAYEHLKGALELCKAVGNRRREASVDAALGDVLVRLGKASDAEIYYREAAKLDPKYAGNGKTQTSHAPSGADNAQKGAASGSVAEGSGRGGGEGSTRALAVNINAANDPNAATGASFKFGKRYAIVVGTDKYLDRSLPTLSNPVYDATSLAQVLHDDYGFEQPVMLLNQSKHEILQAFSKFSAKTYGPADELLVFFAGHGVYDGKLQHDGMIACNDSRADDPDFASYLADSTLRNILDGLPIRHVLLVLDVCFGGAFDKHFVEEGVAAPRGVPSGHDADEDTALRRHVGDVSRFVIMSGGVEEVSDGKPGQHSPFMWGLLDVLGKDSPYLTYEDLLGPLERLKQQPLYDHFGHAQPAARFVFVRKS